MLLRQRADLAEARAASADAEAEEARRSIEEQADRLSVQEDTISHLRGLDRQRSSFLATMSHDLRAPLNSIIGFTDLIFNGMAGPITEEQRRFLTFVLRSSTQLLALINDLLDVARVEAGRVSVVAERFSLDGLLEECVESARAAARKHPLLDVRVTPCGVEVFSDRTLLRRVLDNLISNAVKFTHRGYVKVSCESRGEDVVVCVKDTGIGMRAHDLETLFEPFRQVGPHAAEGTGLGLYLCRALLSVLGGEIWVESRAGVGSTFSFRIPRELEGLRPRDAF